MPWWISRLGFAVTVSFLVNNCVHGDVYDYLARLAQSVSRLHTEEGRIPTYLVVLRVQLNTYVL